MGWSKMGSLPGRGELMNHNYLDAWETKVKAPQARRFPSQTTCRMVVLAGSWAHSVTTTEDQFAHPLAHE